MIIQINFSWTTLMSLQKKHRVKRQVISTNLISYRLGAPAWNLWVTWAFNQPHSQVTPYYDR